MIVWSISLFEIKHKYFEDVKKPFRLNSVNIYQDGETNWFFDIFFTEDDVCLHFDTDGDHQLSIRYGPLDDERQFISFYVGEITIKNFVMENHSDYQISYLATPDRKLRKILVYLRKGEKRMKPCGEFEEVLYKLESIT